jgi:hypothetical protein
MAGQSSQLDVAVAGGAPPYSFDWSPAATLSDATLRNPVATPPVTTGYSVIVTDSEGTSQAGTVTVTVSAPALTACFTVQVLGAVAVQADASCSTGTIVEYRWWPDFLGGTPAPSVVEADPVPPAFVYEVPGTRTIRLEVVDSLGATAVATQTVTTP